MEFSRWKNFLVVLTMSAVLVSGVSLMLYMPGFSFAVQSAAISGAVNNQPQVMGAEAAQVPVKTTPKKLENPPETIKAVYVTSYSAGNLKYREYLAELFKATQINAVVVDIKGSSGGVAYDAQIPQVQKYRLSDNAVRDIDAFVDFLHQNNIYAIGRIAVFEDPIFSKARPDLAIYNKAKNMLWKDNNGLGWMDPASQEVWQYNADLAKDALNNHGFDEINFDYVRFPTDGNMQNMGFPVYDGKKLKEKVIKEFFQYLRKELAGQKISADLFGQTTVVNGDMGIGQVLESALENFDYVAPMVYPSHYINGFIGFSAPAEHPYEVVKYSMEGAIKKKIAYLQREQEMLQKNLEIASSPAYDSRQTLAESTPLPALAKFRPWLQDFNMGAKYDQQKIKEQIQASQDALGQDYCGFMLWNPNNFYTKEAVATY